jgi:hypothetical protein
VHGKSHLPPGAIAGIIIGVLLGLALVVGTTALCIVLNRRRATGKNRTAQTAAAYYHDAPELLAEKEKPPNPNRLSELQGNMIRPGAELDGQPTAYMSTTATNPHAELDGQPNAYLPMAMATTAPLPELDGRGNMVVPQAYPQHSFVAQPVDAMLPPQMIDLPMMAPPMADQPMISSPIPLSELSASPAVTPAAPVENAMPSGTVGPAAAQPSPSSPVAAGSVADSLAKIREEERALEERKRLLLELQDIERKTQESERKKRELSDRLAGLEGRQ